MTTISPESCTVLVHHIDKELINIDLSNDDSLLTNYITVNRLLQDLNLIRRLNFQNKASSNSISSQLHSLDKSLEDLKFEIEYKMNLKHANYKREQEFIRRSSVVDESGHAISFTPSASSKDYDQKGGESESVETLRKRLLSSGNQPSQLDSVQSVENQNQYHESFQEELIDALPSMVSSIKQQALQFQDLLKQDAKILKEASENFEKSHGKFTNVNQLLSKYHKEGKLSWWFYIRVVGSVFIAFLFFVLLVRLIPARY